MNTETQDFLERFDAKLLESAAFDAISKQRVTTLEAEIEILRAEVSALVDPFRKQIHDMKEQTLTDFSLSYERAAHAPAAPTEHVEAQLAASPSSTASGAVDPLAGYSCGTSSVTAAAPEAETTIDAVTATVLGPSTCCGACSSARPDAEFTTAQLQKYQGKKNQARRYPALPVCRMCQASGRW